MSIKRKLILIGICVAIILVVFTVNVIRLMKSDNGQGTGDTVVKENVITYAEAYRLLSYLEYDKAERDAIPIGITYADKSMSDWYDTYVNAVWKMGLIEGNVTVTPKEALTYGTCKALIDNLITHNPEYQNVYTNLSFDFVKADEDMLIPDFLELYRAILNTVPKDKQTVKEMKLFVLGNEVTEDGIDRMVTDQGKFYYQDMKDYEKYIEQKDESSDSSTEKTTSDATTSEDVSTQTSAASEDTQKEDKSDSKTTGSKNSKVEAYLDKGINTLVCGQEIIYITSVTTEETIIHNVWIETGDGQQVATFVSGIHKSFNTVFPLSKPIEKVVGDITIENQKVTRISVKPDLIKGKVLLTGDDFIEIDGYGKVPLDKDFRIYKIYGDISLEPTSSILVGYEATDFVVSDGKISAALIKESIKAKNIRVLLRTTDYKDVFHDKVVFTSNSDFTVKSKDKETSYKANEKVTVEPGSDLLKDGRITIVPKSDSDKIQLLSIERSTGNPKYRGTIEISEGDKGLLVVNELPLEEYLYAVIPSEMPTYYGKEALKVQAVCARSYAYKHLLANSLNAYGAHVDDSVAYQVYNNIPENEDSVLAVKDTYGKVIEYNGDVITAYYFSTSCGHTTNVENVWASGQPTPYLTGKLMSMVDDSQGGEGAQEEDTNAYENLSKEETFRNFITKNDLVTYDSEFSWYRWKVTMDIADIKKVIDSNLANRYNTNPDLILTKTNDAKNEKDAVYESKPVETVGDIVDIKVLKRETSGLISELLIQGTEYTIKVRTEYNIRVLLAPVYDVLTRKDDSKVDKLSLLPSAFFVIDKKEKDGKLMSITLTGGGYGHGVGMSQNGVKAMADSGMTYDQIVPYFYEGTEMGFIYE